MKYRAGPDYLSFTLAHRVKAVPGEGDQVTADTGGVDGLQGGLRVRAMSYEELVAGHVLPVGKFRRLGYGEYQPIAITGSGFTFGEGTFLTCWHCVSRPLDPNEAYCAAVRSEGIYTQTYDRAFELTDLQRAANGADLAIARVGFTVDPVLPLATTPAAWGEDVVSCGYPLPLNSVDPDGGQPKLETNASLLRGYVTRIRPDDRPGWRAIRAYELDMPAPPGLSGAPLFRPDPFEVVGVVYREHDVVVSEADYPITFSLAHHLTTLREAQAGATDNLPLQAFLARG